MLMILILNFINAPNIYLNFEVNNLILMHYKFECGCLCIVSGSLLTILYIKNMFCSFIKRFQIHFTCYCNLRVKMTKLVYSIKLLDFTLT